MPTLSPTIRLSLAVLSLAFAPIARATPPSPTPPPSLRSVEQIDLAAKTVRSQKGAPNFVPPIDVWSPTQKPFASQLVAPTSNTRNRTLAPLQLAPALLKNLNSYAVWVDPSLRETVDANAIFQATQNVSFRVRVLIARRLPPQVKSADELAQIVQSQLNSRDDLVIVATNDDAHLGIFADDLNVATRRQIALDGAQTWTQENVQNSVAQTLRLVSYERKLQLRAMFWRVVLPGSVGVACFLCAFAIWLRRKLKHRARRATFKTSPTTIPVLNNDVTSVESSNVEAV